MAKAPSNPIETKVWAQAGTGGIAGGITYALLNFILPALHWKLTPDETSFIQWFLPLLLATYAGWKAPHTFRPVTPPEPVSNISVTGTNMPSSSTVNSNPIPQNTPTPEPPLPAG